MDWGNVTGEELLDALREVEWSTPPRPLAEFVQRFSAPKNASKWRSRLNYRTNYYILVCFINACCFARNPLALFAVLFAAVAFASLNDSFALSLSERLTRAIRKISPPLAAKLRPPQQLSWLCCRLFHLLPALPPCVTPVSPMSSAISPSHPLFPSLSPPSPRLSPPSPPPSPSPISSPILFPFSVLFHLPPPPPPPPPPPQRSFPSAQITCRPVACPLAPLWGRNASSLSPGAGERE
ncbi:unnamed protein product [Closterium sp. NIES-64]|nr:unnamed protein product [Closterium sp. NIES-64]